MAKKEWKPRRVRSEDERGTGSSGYIQLEEGQSFLGYALFEADLTKDEVGYYEFKQHWNTAAKRSVPCAGDDCPFCEDGDKPKDVANTLWLVMKDEKGTLLGNDGEGELRIFKINSLVIKQFTELRSEDEKILGTQFRVSRLDDRGNYMLAPKTKALTATQVKAQLKSDQAPDFDQMVTSQLRKAMEGIAISRAMDDDDEDEDEKPAKKSAAKKAAKATSEEWPDEANDVVVTVASVDVKKNTVEVEAEEYDDQVVIWGTTALDLTELNEEDVITIDYETDGDGDKVASALTVSAGGVEADAEEVEDIEDEVLELASVLKSKNSVKVDWQDETITLVGADDVDVSDFSKGYEAVVSATWDADDQVWVLTSIEAPEEAAKEEDEESEELPDEIQDEEFTVVSVDMTEQTMEVKSDELEFTLYFLDKGPASKVDFEDYEEGTKIKVSAEKDSTGDLVATAIPEVIEDKPAKRKTAVKPTAKRATARKTAVRKGA